MEVKKNSEADINKSRTSVVVVGLLFVSSLVLASFTYKEEKDLGNGNSSIARNADVLIQEEDPTAPPPPPPETPPQIDAPQPPVDAPIIIEKNKEVPPVVTVAPPPPPVVIGPTQTKVEKEIIDFPEVEAAFPGGPAALQKWIQQNVKYPETAMDMGEQGKVYLTFVVEEDGSISNVAVAKGVSTDLDKEAKRVVRSMPKWTPGETKGEKQRTRCQIPIVFTLK